MQIRDFPFVRYEDFTECPERQMQIICNSLHLDYDENFQTRWFTFDKITGDTAVKGLGSRGSGLNKIRPLARLTIEEAILSQFRANKNYWEALKVLGYRDP